MGDFMEKMTINCEDLLALLLAKFKKIDFMDLQALDKVIYQDWYEVIGVKNYDTYVDDINNFNTYMNYLENKNDFDEHLKKILSKKESSKVYEYLENLDIKELVLRKIKKQGAIHRFEINNYNELERIASDELFSMNALTMRWNDDIVYENYQEIALTQVGKIYLYKKDNKDEIACFNKKLQKNNYDEELIDDFLMKQDLTVTPDQLFTMDNFNTWCCIHDRNPFKQVKVNRKTYEQ